ncbi:MAG TPA: hypothetical protein VGM33_22105 [Baekduia sp.]|jgi:hypothetical protein
MSQRRRLLADQDGFTLVAVTITMMVLGLFAVTAWAAANNALPGVTHDSDRKRAYEAAEAGVQWYQFQLEKDTNYWTACADVPNGVNMQGSRAGWRNVPNSPEQFSIELLGSTSAPTCVADPDDSLLDEGILSIRVTGRFNGKQRQIVAKFRRSGFLNYIYYTKWETLPPAAYGSQSEVDYAKDNCDQKRSLRPSSCSAIQFPGGDTIQGPLHTEDDSLLVCGSPTFGRPNRGDSIEVAAATSKNTAYKQNNCTGTPTTNGTLVAPSQSILPPDNNAALSDVATYKYVGNTCLVFRPGYVDVYPNQTRWGQPATTSHQTPVWPDYTNQIHCTGNPQTQQLHANTVIWVGNDGTCTADYAYLQTYQTASNCGDVAVSGTYSTNVTVGSADDIIVNGNLSNGDSDGIMGLVANQFVRVYHPVTRSSRGGCSNLPGVTPVDTIEAAILATKGSFLTDNWDCGDPLGTLTVVGAIAQYWRGTVGTGSGSTASTGYLKNYNYDSRLRYREPPEFLDPKTAQWGLLLQSEQSPVKSN